MSGAADTRLTRNGVAALGVAYERLGKLLQDPASTVDALAEAAWACGLRLEFRLAPNPPAPECEHVWQESLGDPLARCVRCGAKRASFGDPDVDSECPAGM